MDNIENTQQGENVVTINNEIKKYLLESSKWGKFLAIVGYIGMGMLLLMGIFVMIGGSIFSSISEVDFPLGILGFVYIVLAVIYYIPVNYLHRFSNQIKLGFKSNTQQTVTSGFENLKSLFKFMGIFTIILLSIYVVGIIILIPILIFVR
jgi:hypothetical protein